MSVGSAMDSPIGGLGSVAGTASSAWGGAQSGMQGYGPTNAGGYLGSVGDSRSFSALSPRSTAYMKAGSPGRYGDWVAAGGGAGGGGGGGGQQDLMQMLARMFQQQQQQSPDYSQLFMSPVQLDSPITIESSPQTLAMDTTKPTLANTPRFYSTGGYF